MRVVRMRRGAGMLGQSASWGPSLVAVLAFAVLPSGCGDDDDPGPVASSTAAVGGAGSGGDGGAGGSGGEGGAGGNPDCLEGGTPCDGPEDCEQCCNGFKIESDPQGTTYTCSFPKP